MTTKKKTFKVEDLIIKVNRLNSLSTCDKETRNGWNTLLEEVLRDCNVYEGFGYFSKLEVPVDQTPGVRIDHQGRHYFDNTDYTRRYYYVSDKIRSVSIKAKY